MNHAMAWCMCVGQRLSYRSWFSFSSVWVPEVRHRFYAWYRYLYPLSLPAGPQTAVFKVKHSNTVQSEDKLTYVLRNGSKEMAGSLFSNIELVCFHKSGRHCTHVKSTVICNTQYDAKW